MGFNNWNEYRVGEVCDIRSSKRIFFKDYVSEGIPFYRSKEIILKHKNEKIKDLLYISRDKFMEIKEKYGAPEENDILLTSVGTLGVPYMVKEKEEFYFKDGNLTWFNNFTSAINPGFLYYWLVSPIGKQELDAITIGSTQKALTMVSLRKMKIEIPSLTTQNKIVQVLSSLDESIVNNNKIISNLEEIAQTLFKRWFIDFEFPNENGEPYKSSGGEMVESELGEIPREWSIGSLGSIAKKVGDSIKVEKLEKIVPYIGLEHMPRGSLALSSWETSEKITSNKTSYQKGDILFGKLRPYFKKVGFAPLDGICSTDIVVFNSKNPHYYSYLMCVVSRDEFIDYCNASATGTRMPRTGWNQMTKYKIAMPPGDVVKLFNEYSKPFYERINALILENNNLKSLRDILLPKLFSGEIEFLDETEVNKHVPIP